MEKLRNKVLRVSEYIFNFTTNVKKTAKDKQTAPFLNARLQLLHNYWAQYTQAFEDLCDASDEEQLKSDTNCSFDTYAAVECAFTEAVGWVKHEIDIKTEASTSFDTSLLNSTSQSASNAQVPKLPKITLPSFSGSYLDWPAFADTYRALIHTNAHLSDIQKLHYLKATVSGEAAMLLTHLTITATNYKTAWAILTSRYENIRVLVNSNIQALLNLPNMSSESPGELRRVLDGFTQYVRVLENLKRPVGSWDDWLVYLLANKLDPVTRKDWELSLKSSTEVPTLESLLKFLEARVHTLDALKGSSPRKNNLTLSNQPSKKQSRTFHVATGRECLCCHYKHLIIFCPKFRQKTVSDRWKFVQEKKLCLNCLRTGHDQSTCSSQHRCKHCNKSHHTMLHTETTDSDFGPSSVAHNTNLTQPVPTTTSTFTSSQSSRHKFKHTAVLLATAMVYVKAHEGHFIHARALLDQGSESSFISSNLANRLHLRKEKERVSITGILGSAGIADTAVTTTITSRLEPKHSYTFRALVLPKLTELIPPRKLMCQEWPHLKELELADPSYNNPTTVDLLLGAEVYAQVLLNGVKQGPLGAPMAQSTTFGWILSGSVHVATPTPPVIVSLHSSSANVEEFLKKFWEVEEPPKQSVLTTAERECEEFYKRTHSVSPSGRYIVRLPFSDSHTKLGHSRNPALHALFRMERRFKQDLHLQIQYTKFIHEYLDLNHMELVEDEKLRSDKCYYLPHHAVVKPSSTTTQLRVVFNASQKTASGFSLNSILHAGRKVQNDIFPILLRWRLYPIVLTGDVEKMYRQILIHEDDCDFQRILWRDNPNDPVKCYKLKTVTYGLASAPYLACRTLHQLANDYYHDFPHGARVLKECFYVDDALFGAYDKTTAFQIRNELRTLLKTAGFKLRKWLTNTPGLLDDIPATDREGSDVVKMVNDADFKALGIGWSPLSDTCHINFQLSETLNASKRSILSDIGRIYDPLGWLSPTIISAKIFLQRLWLAKVGWDDELPADLTSKWLALQTDLRELNCIRIPRWVGVTASDQLVELHGFCDASLLAYGAAVYICVRQADDKAYIRLLTAKTRVCPLKTLSLPRLELCGATLLAELIETILPILQFQHYCLHLWTDSTIVLCWLNEHPSRWKVFIANRVALIQTKLPTGSWHHVRSQDNPADCLTRGLSTNELRNSRLWWSGPAWLQQDQCHWPSTETKPSSLAFDEARTVTVTTAQTHDPDDPLLLRYSTLTKLLHVTAYCLRFYSNLKLGITLRRTGRLTPNEVELALLKWIQLIQQSHFGADIKLLVNGSPVKPTSKLQILSPFLDEQAVLRVGGRLKHALLTYTEKFPIILPKSSTFTTLLIKHAHLSTLHGGVQLTLHHLRSKYWIMSGRNTVRQFIRNCFTCCKQRAMTHGQIMASLPPNRVRPAKPFLNSGVDYAGPFRVTPLRRRGQRTFKSYVAVFVCLATRALHLELVHDLSTDAFLAAFRRFVSRRGRCAKLYSDNATNFVGAEKQLALFFRQLHSNSHVAQMLLRDQTEWHFIPPASPHFGGIWEAGVKAFKYHLRRVVNDHILSIEEMTTLLNQIEACLNSRPIHAMSDDPDDLLPLTPGHFLLGEPTLTVPGPDLLDGRKHLTRWETIQSMLQHLWQRWSKEYISTLQLRNKWHQKHRNIEIGDLVLIKEENLPPSKWLLGRIIQTYPGDDGNVRVVNVKHAGGQSKRPVNKLCVLPVHSCENLDKGPITLS